MERHRNGSKAGIENKYARNPVFSISERNINVDKESKYRGEKSGIVLSGPDSGFHSSTLDEELSSLRSLPEKESKGSIEGRHTDANCILEESFSSLTLNSAIKEVDIGKHVEDSVVEDDQEDLNWKREDEHGDTMLHNAILAERLDVVMYILQMVNDEHELNIVNKYRQTPLHLAVLGNIPELVGLLVIKGASTTCRDKQGNSPLHLACLNGFLECVKALTMSTGESSKENISTELLKARNYEGLTCVHLSFINNKMEVLHHLLYSLGCDVNVTDGKFGKTICHIAAESGHLSLTKTLTEFYKADVHKKTYDCRTPLDLAQDRGFWHIVSYLSNFDK